MVKSGHVLTVIQNLSDLSTIQSGRPSQELSAQILTANDNMEISNKNQYYDMGINEFGIPKWINLNFYYFASGRYARYNGSSHY